MSLARNCAALATLPVMLVAATPAMATGPAEILQAECGVQLGLPEEACECIGETAVENLNETQLEMVGAMVKGDDAKATQLRLNMPLNEITEAAMFMTTAPQNCAGG